MIAKSFKSVAWVAAIGAAALICYIFSLQVAEERARLSDLEAQIRRTEQSIRTLKTELGTRGRVHQLQVWAASDFGFTSPKAGQFLEHEVRLASFDLPAETPVMEAPVRMAQAPAPAPEPEKPVQAVAPTPKPERPAVRQASAPTRPTATAAPLLRRASVTSETSARRAPAATPAPKPAKPAATPARAATVGRPATVEPRTSRPVTSRPAEKPAATRAAH